MKIKVILLCLLTLMLTACSDKTEFSWEESSTFQVGIYTMRGEENKIGFTDLLFKAGKRQKYLWHFWADKQDLKGPFKVIGVRESNGKEILVFEARRLGDSSHLGADASLPSTMLLPKKGMWRLDAYINDVLFGSIFVKVV